MRADPRLSPILTRAATVGASVLLFLGAWELVGQAGWLFVIEPVTKVGGRLIEDLAHGELLKAGLATMWLAAVGFGIAAGVGLAVGLLVGMSPSLASAVDPLLDIGNATPIVMLLPVIGLYFGIGMGGKVVLVFLFGVFVIALNTADGIRSNPSGLRELGRAFGLRRAGLYRKVVLPEAAPSIATGLRIGAGRCVQGALVADILLASENLGQYILFAASRFDMTALLAGIVYATALSATVLVAARVYERRVMRWR